MKLNKHALTTAILALCAVGTTIAQGEAPVSPDVRRPTSVVVGVLADGTYRVGRTLITSVDLPVAIRVLAGLPDKPEIILKADKDAPFAQVMSMLDACRNAGLTNVAALTTPAKAHN